MHRSSSPASPPNAHLLPCPTRSFVSTFHSSSARSSHAVGNVSRESIATASQPVGAVSVYQSTASPLSMQPSSDVASDVQPKVPSGCPVSMLSFGSLPPKSQEKPSGLEDTQM